MRTAAYIRRLSDAGMSPDLARAHGEAIEVLLSDTMVTRDHFDATMAKVDSRFVSMEARLEQKIESLEVRLLRKIEGVEIRLDKRIDALDLRIDKLDSKVDRYRDEMRADLAATKVDIIKWNMATAIGLVALVLTAARFFK